MQRTNALRDLLEDMTAVFNDGDRLDVEFDDSSYARPDGTVVVAPNVRESLGRNLSGPQELRCIINTLSHEVEHVRESDLTGKEAFMEEYPEYPRVAGAVCNIVEDQYIDWHRGRRFKGTRKAQAFVVDALMDNHHRRPRIDNMDETANALVEGLLQVSFAGYAKGVSDADDTVREYLAWARDKVDDARREPDLARREEIMHELTEALLDRLPPRPDIDQDALDDLVDDMPTDEVPDMPPQDPGQDDGPADDDGQDQGGDDAGDQGGGAGQNGQDQPAEPTIDVDAILGDYDAADLVVVD